MAQSRSNPSEAEEANEADGGVAQGSHGLGCVTRTDMAGIFAESDVANPVQAVFDAPVASNQGGQAMGIGTLGGQAGDVEVDIAGGAASALVSEATLDAKGLLQAGPRAVALEGSACLQDALLRPAAMQMETIAAGDGISDHPTLLEQKRDIRIQRGLVLLHREHVVAALLHNGLGHDLVAQAGITGDDPALQVQALQQRESSL